MQWFLIFIGISAQFSFALGGFLINRKLGELNPFILIFLLMGIGACFLLIPAVISLWLEQRQPISIAFYTNLLGWIILSSFLFVALAEALYIYGFQIARYYGGIPMFSLTALLFPVFLA